MTRSRTLAASAALAIATLVAFAVPAGAKGGSGGTSAPTTSGPCSADWVITPEFTHYPFTNPEYPGVVSVDIVRVDTIPTVQSVCLDPGWTVQQKSASNGFSLRFFHDGTAALDFTYVLGKTDVRWR